MFARRPAEPGDATTASRLFYAGFLGLPFLWILNYCIYFHTLGQPGTSPSMKFAVRGSLIMFVLVILGFLAWLITYFAAYRAGASWARDLTLARSSGYILGIPG